MKIALSGQQKRVYEWFKNNPKTTIREAHKGIFPGVDKVSARLSEIENKGIKVTRHGRNAYREVLYSIEEEPVLLMKKIIRMEPGPNGRPVAREVEVPVANQ